MLNNEKKLSLLSKLLSNGLKIPHFCYHNSLGLVGSCRICIVEFTKAVKPITACVADVSLVTDENFFYLDSPLVKKARENILEFLLLNHPLDCPVCDQGGCCDLQDQSTFFGSSKRRFYSYKRTLPDKNLGAVVKTTMTRCIHCGRCIRFTREFVDFDGIALLGRGASTEIGTYVNKILSSELSGNLTELCPVSLSLTHDNRSSKTFISGNFVRQ